MDYDARHKGFMLPSVRVHAEGAIGSGTIIYSQPNDQGEHSSFVLTNCHVIEGAIKIETKWSPLLKREIKTDILSTVGVHLFEYLYDSRASGARSVMADPVAYDKDEDLALLKLRSPVPAAAVATLYPRGQENKLRVTMPVYCVGSGLGEVPLITQGMLCQFGVEIANREFWLSSAPAVFGNCLPDSALIFTNPGTPLPINQIAPGTRVYSYDGAAIASVPVASRTIPVFKHTVRVVLNTRTLDASTDHPVLTARRLGRFADGIGGNGARVWRNRWGLAWKMAGQLQPNDIVAVSTALPETVSRNVGRLFARFAGCYIGDGSSRERRGEGGDLTLHLFDSHKRRFYRLAIALLFGKQARENTRGISVYSIKVARHVASEGLTGKAITKRVPSWVFGLPRDEKIAFIEGYMDADGWRAPGHYQFEANNRALIDDLRCLCIGLGWRVSNVFMRTRQAHNKNRRGVEFRANAPSAMFQAYPTSTKRYLPQKAYGLERLQIPGMGFEAVRRVHDAGIQACYDIIVPGTHNFIANGVFVHNSGGALFLMDTAELIGVPARIAVIMQLVGVDAITHLSYAIPITRIYNFLEAAKFRFVFDPEFTEEGERETRRKLREDEEYRLARKET